MEAGFFRVCLRLEGIGDSVGSRDGSADAVSEMTESQDIEEMGFIRRNHMFLGRAITRPIRCRPDSAFARLAPGPRRLGGTWRSPCHPVLRQFVTVHRSGSGSFFGGKSRVSCWMSPPKNVP